MRCRLSRKRRSPEVLREAPAGACEQSCGRLPLRQRLRRGGERRKHPHPGQKWSDSVKFRGGGFQPRALEIHVCLLLAGGWL